MEELKYNKNLYKNRKDLLNEIIKKDKAYWDYCLEKDCNPRKLKAMWIELNNLFKEINKANNIYYHENEWINDYCHNVISPKLQNQNLTGEKLIDFVVNELNKLDGIVIREIKYKGQGITNTNKYRDNLYNYEIFVITPTKIYSYYLNRGYAGTYQLKPNTPVWTNNKLVNKHLCELLYDGIIRDESIYNEYLPKN